MDQEATSITKKYPPNIKDARTRGDFNEAAIQEYGFMKGKTHVREEAGVGLKLHHKFDRI
jgi:hypothetical protein